VKATDFVGALQALTRHKVDFVLIGGLAARLHGSPTVTIDVDICPSRESDNLERLAEALREMNAQLRTVGEDVPFKVDAGSLERTLNLTLTTMYGALDILAEPSGTSGYSELAANAKTYELDDLQLKVASLEDLMRMKEAAGRPKDRIELEILGALREELEDRSPD
jgi:hypothetical protein